MKVTGSNPVPATKSAKRPASVRAVLRLAVLGAFSSGVFQGASSEIGWEKHPSLVNSARLNGLDPETWLADVLEQIVSGSIPVNRLDELLPWNWKADREARGQLERVAA
ncbi:MAG: transposase domain-containing protein [Mesorhizobium sp.]|nr:MAG: transposase domain-containing protein [Mesorhizobium sp.]TJW50489.1 MAG: transposase domain-containing protein [Mesorhizobium sp.]